MKKRISIIILVILSVCVTNAQDIIRTITAGNWTNTLEKDVTYTLEPFGSNINIKEGETNLFSLALPVMLTFSSTLDPMYDEGVIINGIKWATRNVAAHGKFVEKPEDYGAIFQWGRKGDGHEQRTSPNYPTNDTNPENGAVSSSENFDENGQIVNTHAAFGKFIKQVDSPRDWRIPQINTLWNSGSEAAPIKTANDPCPDGWRVPTHADLNSLTQNILIWTTENGVNGYRLTDNATGNSLFLPATGARNYETGAFSTVGEYGSYWTSASGNTEAHYLVFGSDFFETYYIIYRAFGLSVRCVAEQ